MAEKEAQSSKETESSGGFREDDEEPGELSESTPMRRTSTTASTAVAEVSKVAAGKPKYMQQARRQSATMSVEQLRGDLASARLRAGTAEREVMEMGEENSKLIEKVAKLESEVRTLRQTSDKWRERCMLMEQENANLALKEDTVQGQLRESQNREKEFAIQAIQGRINCTEADNEKAKALAEARSISWHSQNVESKLNAKIAEAEDLRAKLREARTGQEALRTEKEVLTANLTSSKTENQLQTEVLADEERRREKLEAKIASLENQIQLAEMKHSDFAKELNGYRMRNEELMEVNQKLRLDLQEEGNKAQRALEHPFYASRLEGGLSACAQDLSTNKATPLSPRSRFDYPKGNHAGMLRQKILSARQEALDHSDTLGAGLW